MADNTTLNAGTGGDVIASDDIAGVKYQRVKLALGADGAAADAAVGGGTEATSLRVTIASDSTGVLSVDDNGGALTVDNAGTFAVQVDGAALTALQLIDNIVLAEDAAHVSGDVGVQALAVRSDTLAAKAGTTGDYSPLQVDAAGALYTRVVSSTGATIDPQVDDAAFTAATSLVSVIAGVATSDSVDSGDAGAIAMTTARAMHTAVRSIEAGANVIGDVGISGARTSGGTTIFRSIDIDETEEEIKATAGQIYWISAINLTAAVLYLKFYNATAANVTVGTTTPVLTFPVPSSGTTSGGGFVLSIPNGIAFGTAISVACTTGVADNDTGAPAASACVINIGYA